MLVPTVSTVSVRRGHIQRDMESYVCSEFLPVKGRDSEKRVCSESCGEQGILLQGYWDVDFKRVALMIKIIRFIYISADKTSLWEERNMCKRIVKGKRAKKSKAGKRDDE